MKVVLVCGDTGLAAQIHKALKEAALDVVVCDADELENFVPSRLDCLDEPPKLSPMEYLPPLPQNFRSQTKGCRGPPR